MTWAQDHDDNHTRTCTDAKTRWLSLQAKFTSVSASSPLVGFGKLNDNTIKGLTNLLSVKQEIKLLHTLVDCGMRSVYRFNKKANLICHIVL